MLSTDADPSPRRVHARRLALAAILATACLHHTSDRIRAVCSGANVGRRYTLVLDSVTAAAGDALLRMRGESFDITLNLFNPLSTARCEDRSGQASATVDELPDELARATSRTRDGRWWVDGVRVAVDLNPGTLARHLQFFLPLDDSPGSWRLGTLAGPVASGRLLGGR